MEYDINPSLKNIYEPIKNDINKLEEELLGLIEDTSELEAKKILNYFFKYKGKMIRPALIFFTGFSIREDKKNTHNLLPLALAIELIHNASIIHDDVIDDSKKRRKQQTLNNLVGNKKAILAGDLLFSYAFQKLTKHFDKSILNLILDKIKKMCYGDIIQLDKNILNREEYYQVIEYKTGSLFSAACETAAIIMDETINYSDLFKIFGNDFGILYQLIDDYQDKDIEINIDFNFIKEINTYQEKTRMDIQNIPDSIYKTGLLDLVNYITKGIE